MFFQAIFHGITPLQSLTLAIIALPFCTALLGDVLGTYLKSWSRGLSR